MKKLDISFKNASIKRIVAALVIPLIVLPALGALVIQSNTVHFTWQVGCSGGTGVVCVFNGPQIPGASNTNFTFRSLSTQALASSSINATLFNGPPGNIVYSLNGTAPTGTAINGRPNWIIPYHPYAINTMYSTLLQLRYNATGGFYDIGINVVA